MEKLARFGVLFIMYVLSFVVVYTIVPAVVWTFGGSFIEVAQSVPYATFATLFINISLCIIYGECFDTNFRSKK